MVPGTYLLEVLDTQSVWPTVRLEVSATGKARALLTHSRQPLPFPLPLEPLVAKPTFFEKREGFQWSSMLMNPECALVLTLSRTKSATCLSVGSWPLLLLLALARLMRCVCCVSIAWRSWNRLSEIEGIVRNPKKKE